MNVGRLPIHMQPVILSHQGGISSVFVKNSRLSEVFRTLQLQCPSLDPRQDVKEKAKAEPGPWKKACYTYY